MPVYNSQETLRELVHRIRRVFGDITEHYEVLLVDDASSDDSPTIASSLSQEDRRTRVVRLERNVGQHCAIVQGFNESRGARVIVLDDDLQHPPDEIPRVGPDSPDVPEVETGEKVHNILQPWRERRRDS